MADSRLSDNCKVTVADDNMSATLFLEPPIDGIAYAVDDLVTFVKSKGVYGGILYSELEEMTTNNIYGEDHVIAKGIYPTEGEPGFYEVMFDYSDHRTPAIRSDGSVDYQSMSEINTVDAGDELVRYHAAVQGTHGYDVRGRVLRAMPCKELPRMKGVGFTYDEDTGIYSAAVGGKIEYDGKSIRVSEIYEYRKDLDLVVGKIDFRGDVLIKGNVQSGTFIRATKSITIEGNVEGATIIAGGDVVLKKGMQGGNKARISAGGDVYANFLEFTKVEAKGRIEANIIMNCDISAGENVAISGKRGALIGGTTYANGSISTTFLGNTAGLKTVASVGIAKEVKERYKVLSRKLDILNKELETLSKEIIKVTDTRIAVESREVRVAKLSQLSRRLEKSRTLSDKLKIEIEEIENRMTVGKHATISVSNAAYRESVVMIDELTKTLERDYMKASFKKNKTADDIDIKEG